MDIDMYVCTDMYVIDSIWQLDAKIPIKPPVRYAPHGEHLAPSIFAFRYIDRWIDRKIDI